MRPTLPRTLVRWLALLAMVVPISCLAQSGTAANIAKLLGLTSSGGQPYRNSVVRPRAANQPEIASRSSAFSVAVVSGTIQPGVASTGAILGDWDGREDACADHSATIVRQTGNTFFTRWAVSEHTVANGFNENIFFAGDNAGNFFAFTDTSGTPAPESTLAVNVPQLISTGASGGVTLLNAAAGDGTSGNGVITGIAVNPVADLGDFGGAFSDKIGEIVYVSFLDVDGGTGNAANQPFHTRIFAFGFTDAAGGLTSVGARQLLRSQFYNLAGLCVDDDGSLYFQLVDLLQKTNGAIFKATELSRTVAGAATNPRINRAISIIPTVSTLTSAQGTNSAPYITSSGIRLSNFSGPSTTFGNIVSLCAGPDGRIYAAVAASFDGTASSGPFVNPAALGPTPSMVICFSDRIGGDEVSNSPSPAGVPNGLADVVIPGATRTPGVNNFKAYVLGNGPDPRASLVAATFAAQAVGKGAALAPSKATVFGTTASTLKLDLQIDYSIYSGIMVDEDAHLYVISGGSPAGAGLNPSPSRGEILSFVDSNPRDLRADYIDYRGDNPPNPPASGGNVGDGDSDRFDHIFLVAPLDGSTFTPQGLAGLSRGFLRYTQRLAPNAMSTGITLGQTGGATSLGDDEPIGPLLFDAFDPGHQVAGGDDQNSPFRGDDDGGAGVPPATGALNGGFEFDFGPAPGASSVRNAFFINSNGNITFGAGDSDNTPSVAELRAGPARIAALWMDLNPSMRTAGGVNAFPLTALGFAGVNAFKIRFINVPEFAKETSSNTFSITLYDDGTSIDENANQPLNPANPIGNNAVPFDLQEGPTDLRFVREPVSGVLIGQSPRKANTGNFCFDYAGMTALGSPTFPILVGYSIGGQAMTDPPGLCDINLSEAARSVEDSPFQVIQGETVSITKGLLGDGTEPTLQQLFNTGDEGTGLPALDLKSEGSDPNISTPAAQTDLNREHVAFYGNTGSVPPPPIVNSVQAVPKGLTAGTVGAVNAYGDLPINIIGSGFFPTITTTVCEGDPTARAGKSISTAASLLIDTNSDGTPELSAILQNVTVVSENLITATIPKAIAGSAFPLTVNNDINRFGTVTVIPSFSAGDNNVFAPFPRPSSGSLSLGNRAPVVTAVTPLTVRAKPGQQVTLTGASFQLKGATTTPNVTRVFAVKNVKSKVPQVPIDAASFTVDNDGQISATFNFSSKQIGQSFLIFASGPSGPSRNATVLPAGAVPSNPLGNEEGHVITLKLTPK